MSDLLPPLDGATLAIAVTALAAGLVRGFAGFGAGMIFIPIASALYGPKIGAGAILIADGVLTLPHVFRAAPLCDRRSVVPVALAAIALIPVGTWLLTVADPVPVRWALAAIIAALLALILSGWRYHGAPRLGASLGVGAVAGFLSGFIQISGPPVIAYWLSGPGAPQVIRANIFVFFGVTSAAAVVSYSFGGIFGRGLVAVIVAMAPLYALGLFAGGRLFRRASERGYRLAAAALIALAVIVSLPALDPLLR